MNSSRLLLARRFSLFPPRVLNLDLTDRRSTRKKSLAISSTAYPDRPLLHSSLGKVSTTVQPLEDNFANNSRIAPGDLLF